MTVTVAAISNVSALDGSPLAAKPSARRSR
jgi:hypothetical protein